MSLGLTREEVQEIIKAEIQAHKSSTEKDIQKRDIRIADLTNKYNSLMIDFKALKVKKPNSDTNPYEEEDEEQDPNTKNAGRGRGRGRGRG